MSAATPALVARGLGRRYGRRWALQDADLDLPAGAVAALVGPNGAGKTTLLHLAAGLLRPSAGTVEAFGGDPATDRDVLGRIALVAQDQPLWRSFSVADTLRAGRALNRGRWDDQASRQRLDELGIPLDQRVGTLSGGQRAQVALAVALSTQPELLLLDEPLASLDPLARRDLLSTLMATAAERGVTVVLSSHLVSDLERVCDHLVVVAGGRVRLAGSIEELLAGHRVLTGPVPSGPVPGVAEIVHGVEAGRSATLTVRTDGPLLDPRWAAEDINLEELVLAYLTAGSSAGDGRDRLHVLDSAGVA